MSISISAHFDGQFLVPDEPIDLPVGQPLKVQVQVAEATTNKFADLRALATELPGAPTDLSLQHDHYLYGSPKQ